MGSKSIVSSPPVIFAWPTAQRRLPTLPSSSVFVTVNDGTVRCSSASRAGRARNGALRKGRGRGGGKRGRIEEGVLMGPSQKKDETGSKIDYRLWRLRASRRTVCALDSSFPNSVWERRWAKLCFAAVSCTRETEFQEKG